MKSIILEIDSNMIMTAFGPYHNIAIAEKARLKYIGRSAHSHFIIFPLKTGLMVTSQHNTGYAEDTLCKPNVKTVSAKSADGPIPGHIFAKPLTIPPQSLRMNK